MGILRFMKFVKDTLHILKKAFVFGLEGAKTLDVFDFDTISWHKFNNDTFKTSSANIEF